MGFQYFLTPAQASDYVEHLLDDNGFRDTVTRLATGEISLDRFGTELEVLLQNINQRFDEPHDLYTDQWAHFCGDAG